MSDPSGLENLVNACKVALEGNGQAGRDLAVGHVGSDDGAEKLQRIKQAFQDSRNVDWNEIHNDGLAILGEESKDLFALWAMLAPLPIVQGHGFSGVAVSLQACNLFIEDYWESMFPLLPDGLKLRASIFTQMVHRWTTFVKRATPTEADSLAINTIAGQLEEFEQKVYNHFPKQIAPQFGELRQLIKVFAQRFAPAEDQTAEEAEAPAEAESPPASGAHAGPSADELERAYVAALSRIASRPEQALREMSAIVDQQPTTAGKFRGQVYLGELYLRAGHSQLARQLLSFLEEECGRIKLEDWEPVLCGKLWSTLYQALVAEHGGGDPPKDVKEKLNDLFGRVCRVDAKQAIVLKNP